MTVRDGPSAHAAAPEREIAAQTGWRGDLLSAPA
jgi:hypothetical protein